MNARTEHLDASFASLARAAAVGAALLAGSGQVAMADANSDLIAKGKYLTAAGDCEACHTAKDGQPFAGGRSIPTPFGPMYSPNITPDKETGIGAWSDKDFYNALGEGIAKNGDHLYPVMPYPWYTRVTQDDMAAIKAYLFSLQPVHAPKKPNDLSFPFNIRAGMIGWNALFFHPGVFKPDPSKSAEINRGAYLVEGLGHCGDCHTPKNIAQAPASGEQFAGEPIQGWYAPNITSDVREGIGGWSEDDVVTYLKTGAAKGKGVVLGPMAETVHKSLGKLTDADLHAIAAYLKSTPAKTEYVAAVGSDYTSAHAPGASIYLSNCAFCHQTDGKGNGVMVPPLAGNGAVAAQGPENVIRAVLGGLPANGSYGPMPAIGASMTNEQVADVANYVRQTWGNGAPATATPGKVADLRKESLTVMANDASHGCPALNQDLSRLISDPATGIEGKLQGINQANLLENVRAIVGKVKAADKNLPQAELVNGLTAAYCPIVNADASLGVPQRRWYLDRFSQLVYTEALNGGHN